MHSEILINKKGIVQSSSGDAPPEGGVCVIRNNQEFSIIFDDNFNLTLEISNFGRWIYNYLLGFYEANHKTNLLGLV